MVMASAMLGRQVSHLGRLQWDRMGLECEGWDYSHRETDDYNPRCSKRCRALRDYRF